jgi:hypothetical protein
MCARMRMNAPVMRATLPQARTSFSNDAAPKSLRSMGRRQGSTMFSTHPRSKVMSSAAPVVCSSSAISPGRGSNTVR